MIVFFSGGHGSTQFKKALVKKNKDIIKHIYTIVNCYDNGKSTGIVRRYVKGLLGPSDLRKQLLLDAKLYGNPDIKSVIDFLEYRIKSTLRDEAYEEVIQLLVNEIKYKSNVNFEEAAIKLEKFINIWFEEIDDGRIIYKDFNVGNIIFGSLAHYYVDTINPKGNINEGLVYAADYIAKNILNIKNNVYINSLDNLFLVGVAKDGSYIYDEAEIVSWGDPDNKIVDVKLFTEDFYEKRPYIYSDTLELIKNNDIFIAAPGTQFSSLIPTYLTEKMWQYINKIHIIVNTKPDLDMAGYTIEGMIAKIREYIPKDVEAYFYYLTHENMIIRDSFLDGNSHLIPVITKGYIEDVHSIHQADEVMKTIFNIHYNGLKTKKYFIFDYDGTLFSTEMNSDEKKQALNSLLSIFSSIKRITQNPQFILITGRKYSEIDNDYLAIFKEFRFDIFSSYLGEYNGKVIYRLIQKDKTSIINKIVELNRNTTEFRYDIRLQNIVFNPSFINIKKVKHRDEFVKSFNLKNYDFVAVSAGKKSVDIVPKKLLKGNIFNMLKKVKNINVDENNLKDFIYICDEINGNDKDLASKIDTIKFDWRKLEGFSQILNYLDDSNIVYIKPTIN